jgi:hypothetical protein
MQLGPTLVIFAVAGEEGNFRSSLLLYDHLRRTILASFDVAFRRRRLLLLRHLFFTSRLLLCLLSSRQSSVPSFQYAPSSLSHPLDILRGLSGMRLWLFRTATPLSRSSDFAHQLDDGSSSGVGGGDDARRRRRV